MNNMFCDRSNLRNEADVEQIFARRLLEALGYSDKAIRPKTALEELTVGKVSSQGKYRPDFAMKSAGHIRWVFELKAPGENLDKHIEQASEYCEGINGSYARAKPVKYFVLSNGVLTRVYKCGEAKPHLELKFGDFQKGNRRYDELVQLLRPKAFVRGKSVPTVADTIHFTKPTIAEVNNVFAKCHQYIHSSDKISQAAGFEEFVKLITLKLLSDKAVRDAYPGVRVERQFDHPAGEVEFSLHWIRRHESSASNPVDSVLFKRFMDDVEKQIARRVRKRFFDKGEQINLKPETIKGVVQRLEGLFLYGIDADLNGRLFENFLSATMRGKDLGQYFTPRTLVKLGVGLGQLTAEDVVLDGCCGTGGFLIDALAEMWRQVNANESLSNQAKKERRHAISNDQIYGIDFAKSPNLAKIARLNMYLHGDGGSRIYNVDGLDLDIGHDTTDIPEETTEKDELRDLKMAGRVDAVLTNPPFSKRYEKEKLGDARVLSQYEVAVGKRNLLAKLMFFEMYFRYLKPRGRLVSVIDDGFLNASSYRWFREMIRERYIIKAVISLPGDAFQRSEARVKTSFIVLEKRKQGDADAWEDQPSIFMYPCRYVGIDDPKRRRWMPGDDDLREDAREEVRTVVREYRRFLEGNGDKQFIVPASRAVDRLDVKHCLIKHNWRKTSSSTCLSDVVDRKGYERSDIVECETHEGPVQLFTVKYEGIPAADRVIFPRTETEYAELYRVRAGEIVISNIAASYGSVAVVTSEFDGLVVSKEYTVLVAKADFDPRVIWALLRTDEIRAEMLVRATGANRSRIRWEDIRDIPFPYPDKETEAKYLRHVEAEEEARANALREREAAGRELISTEMELNDVMAKMILDAFKPPK